jgi:hypothetical protein
VVEDGAGADGAEDGKGGKQGAKRNPAVPRNWTLVKRIKEDHGQNLSKVHSVPVFLLYKVTIYADFSECFQAVTVRAGREPLRRAVCTFSKYSLKCL